MAEPLLVYKGAVQPDWIDYNGHMRDGYFGVVCSTGTDKLMDHLGIDEAYRQRTRRTLYTLEVKIRFVAEISESEDFYITAQLLNADAKRLHIYLRMCRQDSGDLVASHESIMLHVDQAAGPASAPFPEDVAARVQALLEAHRPLPFPEDASRPITMGRKSGSG